MRQKILILIVSVLASIIVLSSLNEANAIHDTKGLTTLNDLKESSFFLEIKDVVDKAGIGLNSICDQKNKKGELLVPEKRCVFEIESIRYIPKDVGIFGRNIFNVICIDTSDFDEFKEKRTIFNCFVPAQGEVSIGSGFSLGPDGGVTLVIGELANASKDLTIELTLDVAFSVPLAPVETVLAQGDFRGNRIGGNVLLDSGIGSLLVHKHMALGHDDFSGTIEIFGKKPDSMELEIGMIEKPFVGDPKFSCGLDGKKKCTVDADFSDTLHYVCPRCPKINSNITFDRETILVETQPITLSDATTIIENREDEIIAIFTEIVLAALDSEVPAAESEVVLAALESGIPTAEAEIPTEMVNPFDLGEFLFKLFEIDTSAVDGKILGYFTMLLDDLLNFLDRVTDDPDWGKDEDGNKILDHIDLSAEIEKIKAIVNLLDIKMTLTDIDDAQKSIITAVTPLCISFDKLGIFEDDITAEFCIDTDGNLESHTLVCQNRDIDGFSGVDCHRHCDNGTHHDRPDSDCAACFDSGTGLGCEVDDDFGGFPP